MPFDLDEWAASVAGRTVRVTAPEGLGYEASRLTTSPVPSAARDPYCGDCGEHVRLVKSGGEVVGHCPLCGREPGMLELGTRRAGV